MPNEYISYEQVQAGADELRKCANIMEEIFNNVSGQMRNMTTTETAEFDQFKSGFTDYVNKVREFVDAFTAASDTLQATEEQLKKNVEQL